MKISALCLLILIALFSCENDTKKPKVLAEEKTDIKSESSEKTDSITTPKNENISSIETGEIKIEDNIFTEYYPGEKKRIKFQGEQDEKGRRHGKWLYFSEESLELSITNYIHGKRNGMSLVKYPNGNIHYTGEYLNDKTVGVWKTYSIEGIKTGEKNYGYPK